MGKNQTNWTMEDAALDVEERLFKGLSKDDSQQSGLLGMELEMFPLKKGAKGWEPLPLRGENSLSQVLEQILLKEASWTPLRGAHGGLQGLKIGKNAHLSFEPGAQLEIATAPHDSLEALKRELIQIQTKLQETFHHKAYALLH